MCPTRIASVRRLAPPVLLALGTMACFFIPDPVSAHPSLASVLEPIRLKYKLPSLAATIFTTDGIVEMAAVGVRKAGTEVPVTTSDLWHLGSDTKMMTATLAGTFVAANKLAWDTRVISFFPEIADRIPDQMRDITLAQVLSHQAGLRENLDWRALSTTGSVTEQRRLAAEMALIAPAYLPGAYHYANTDYVVVGAILEKISGQRWEDLIREKIFEPLKMDSVGFGGLGTLGQIDQPWPHFESGTPVPLNGPAIDNPEIMGPAGTVHCTMNDWAKFLIDQLRGGAGMTALLPDDIYLAMQSPVHNLGYGYGWSVTGRPWAGGKALWHNGSNRLNYSVCWLAPAKKFGILICTNEGGDNAEKACADDAANILIKRYLAAHPDKPMDSNF
ncbi:MAG: beta-lactamase family protein [Methylacidiphilales bacterium]|nr:beta-lactamase family protein [Candidatus Methylacidiphilales bacterium]